MSQTRAIHSLLAIAILATTLPAQKLKPEISVPRVIRYTGTLPSTDLTGAKGAIFSIYRDQQDGAPLWSEVQNIQADAKGGYSIMLGATRNEGLPTNLFNTAEPRWLEVETNGIKEPRVQLGSVPYAMVAADAQTLGGLPPSAYLHTDLYPTNTSTTPNVAPPLIGFKPNAISGSPGYLSIFTTGSDLGNSALYQNGNAISIGGTTSLGAMTLIGSAPFGDTAGMALYNSAGGAGASVSLDMYNTSFNGGIPQAKIKALDDGAYSDHLTFWTKVPGALNNPVAERVRITSAGNVGIGTTTPGATLEVAGNLKLSGPASGIIFPDGTSLTTALFQSFQNFGTAVGFGALGNLVAGTGDTAVGYNALNATTSGSGNTATGYNSLVSNNIGNANAAFGAATLTKNTTGNYNIAIGNMSMNANVFGSYNTAVGGNSLNASSGGSNNTALGYAALSNENGGSNNIAIGYNAGTSIQSGNNNIDLGSHGVYLDTNAIRIGDVQTQTYMAGISGVNVSGVPVVVSNTGQLGIVSSSRRFKEDINDMADASNSLMRLRPVTYRYKQPFADGSKPLDYGLIAEEVSEIYPDLVAHSQDGQIQTVMYQKLTPMLLNEVQKLNKELTTERTKTKSLEDRMRQLEALVEQLATASNRQNYSHPQPK
jgi:hypothetical protein